MESVYWGWTPDKVCEKVTSAPVTKSRVGKAEYCYKYLGHGNEKCCWGVGEDDCYTRILIKWLN